MQNLEGSKNKFIEFFKRKSVWVSLIVMFVILVCSLVIWWIYFDNPQNENNSSNPTASENITVSDQSSSDGSSTTDSANNFDSKGESSNYTEPSSSVSDSTNPYDYYNAGLYNLNDKDYDKAIENFNRAIALKTTDPNFYLKKSEAQANKRDYDGAIETTNEGLEANPGNELLLNNLDILNDVKNQ